jgi:tRNA 5-methylaminomethyl-2-thiouridine biosynthesis bifunctional protein
MRSTQFDDIYFSAEDGLAETRHTFLDGNDLPGAWAGRDRFCICETGFGTGLNMLAAWRLFEESASGDQRLDLISIEKYPLSRDEIRSALSPWDLQQQLDRLLDLYPLRVPGFHRLNLSARVTLTLIFDDVHDALPQLDARVDAWFLDGFAPAKNPDMWTSALFEQMARMSAPGASVATFTAAGDVRRGLAGAGFTVEKRPGYGRKRDMVVGRFAGAVTPSASVRKSIAVVGAGLAGLSAAWHLRRAGHDVTVYDAAGVAAGASGNDAGIMNPKLTTRRSATSDYYTFAYDYALRFMRDLGVRMNSCGSVHVQTNDDRARKFEAYAQNLGWHGDHMTMLSAGEASDAAGVPIAQGALFYPDATLVSPRDVCATLAQGMRVDIRTVDDVKTLDADVVVLANASDVVRFCDVPVGRVRGQVSRVGVSDVSANVRSNICYGGYFTPAVGGMHMCGATFQPWESDANLRADDDARNLAQLEAAVPALAGLSASGGWVGFRAASKDRLPIVGMHDGMVLSVGHGSHGLISGIAAGALVCAAIGGDANPVPRDVITLLSPRRFGG